MVLTEIFKNAYAKLVLMGKQSMSFITMNMVLFFAVMGFIFIVFDLSGFMLVFELGILAILALLLAFSMSLIYQNESSGWSIIGALLIVLLLNVFFVSLVSVTFGSASIITIFFSIIGLAIAVLNVLGDRKNIEPEIGYVKQDYYIPVRKTEPETL